MVVRDHSFLTVTGTEKFLDGSSPGRNSWSLIQTETFWYLINYFRSRPRYRIGPCIRDLSRSDLILWDDSLDPLSEFGPQRYMPTIVGETFRQNSNLLYNRHFGKRVMNHISLTSIFILFDLILHPFTFITYFGK